MSIVSFRCITTKSLFMGRRIRRFQDIQRVAIRKLAMLDAAVRLEDLRIPRPTAWNHCAPIVRVSTASASTTSTDCASHGPMQVLQT